MEVYRPRADRILVYTRLSPVATALGQEKPTPFAVAKPVNDLLGARADEEYGRWLIMEWGRHAPTREQLQGLTEEGGFCDTLAQVARDASEQGGSIDYETLAAELSAIRYYRALDEGGADWLDVPSLAHLAAWALVQELDRGKSRLVTCGTCGKPWFMPVGRAVDAALWHEGWWHCHRPAPGKATTCAQLHARETFEAERGEWAKEYRKVMARKVRGTVSEQEFRAWKSVSGPAGWTSFDEWKANREEGSNA